jgi:hypothetical protein
MIRYINVIGANGSTYTYLSDDDSLKAGTYIVAEHGSRDLVMKVKSATKTRTVPYFDRQYKIIKRPATEKEVEAVKAVEIAEKKLIAARLVVSTILKPKPKPKPKSKRRTTTRRVTRRKHV